jgi:hypothetical protein
MHLLFYLSLKAVVSIKKKFSSTLLILFFLFLVFSPLVEPPQAQKRQRQPSIHEDPEEAQASKRSKTVNTFLRICMRVIWV